MESHERVELLEQCGRSLLWWNVSRGCNDMTSASNSSKNSDVPSVRLAVGHKQSVMGRIAQLAGAKIQLERRFVHIDAEYASGDEISLWREIDATLEAVYWADERCEKF